jgi:hypothetical protein
MDSLFIYYQGHGLNGRGFLSQYEQDFFVQTGCGTNPASYSKGTGDNFPGVKAAGA